MKKRTVITETNFSFGNNPVATIDLKVFLCNRGDKAKGQHPREPIQGTQSDYFQECRNVPDAKQKQREYMERFNLSNDDYLGGQVFLRGRMIAALSSNGMYFTKGEFFETSKEWFEANIQVELAKAKLN